MKKKGKEGRRMRWKERSFILFTSGAGWVELVLEAVEKHGTAMS